jgi:hypothetical protein
MTPLGHIISIVAIWAMMLFGLRFAIAATEWMLPVTAAFWRLVRCGKAGRTACARGFIRAVAKLHIDFRRAIVTPWSGPLLFIGSALIGFGYAFGSAGDAMKLVSRRPETWQAFDVGTDAIAAVLSITGMSFVLASTAQRRTASFLVSAALIGTGIGIGVVTL